MSRPARLVGDWSGLVVICAGVPWNESAQLDQHFALGLSAFAPVLYVDPPKVWRPGPLRRALRPPKAMSSRANPSATAGDVERHAELRLVCPSLARLTPQLPPGSGTPGRAVAANLVRRSLRRALTAMGAPDVTAMLAFVPDAPFGVGDPDRTAYVIREGDPVTRPAGFGRRAHEVSAEDLRLDDPHGVVDFVVVGSPGRAELLRRHHPLLVPYGCPETSLSGTAPAERTPDVQLPHPIAGFVGRLSTRLDLSMLSAVVDRGMSLLLVGPCSRPEMVPGLVELLQDPHVTWVGPRARSSVRSYLREIDVGLVPYADTDQNQLSFPTQTLDYLAAGRPVVSTDLVATRWLQGTARTQPQPSAVDGREDLVIASAPDAFAAAAARVTARGRTRSEMVRRHAFARAHSWDQRIETLAEALGLDHRGTTGRPPEHGRADGSSPHTDQEAVA